MIKNATPSSSNRGDSNATSTTTTERVPLSSTECSQLFDDDGRLVKEVKLRKALFEGTCHLIITVTCTHTCTCLTLTLERYILNSRHYYLYT